MTVQIKHTFVSQAPPRDDNPNLVDSTKWNDVHVVPVASTAQAQAGTDNTVLMTPAKTADAIAAQVLPVTLPTTDNAIARFDGTGGRLQNSGVTINDANAIAGLTGLDLRQTDTSSAATIPTVLIQRSNLQGTPSYPPGTVGRAFEVANVAFGDIANFEYGGNISASQNDPITTFQDIVGLKAGALRGVSAIGSVNGIWGMNIDLQDRTGRKSSLTPGTFKGNELNLTASGQDDENVRIGNDTILREYSAPISGDTTTSFYAAYRAIPASALSNDQGLVSIKYGYLADGNGTTGRGDIQVGYSANTSVVGFVTEGAPASAAAFWADHASGSDWTAFKSPGYSVRGDGAVTGFVFNNVLITQPATGAILTLLDGTTLTGPAASGTVMTLGNDETVTGVKTFTAAIVATTTVRTGSYIVSGLPSAATAGAGARAFVTDATVKTFASTVIGGGGNAVPVVSTGAAWIIG